MPQVTDPDADTVVPGKPRGAEPLLGREVELAWARERLGDPRATLLQIWGRTGSGRTRMLAEIAREAERLGARTIHCPADPYPYSELGYAALSRIVARLASEPSSWPAQMDRGAAVAALRSNAKSAVERGEGAVVLLVDDLDGLDRPSRAALRDLLAGDAIAGFRIVSTSERALAMGTAGSAHELRLQGLSYADGTKMLGDDRLRGLEGTGDIEPLLIEQLERCPSPGGPPLPTTLRAVVEWRIRSLPPAEQRILQTLGLTGGSPAAALASTLASPGDIDEALANLTADGFVETQQGRVVARHALYARVAVAMAPLGAVTELSARAADELAGRGDLLELRAHHAIRAEPDFDAYMLTEESVRLRERRGDLDGVIATLRDAVGAARRQVSRGDEMGETAWVLFGRKLGTALLTAGRQEEALGVLEEVLELPTLDDSSRDVVLEQIGGITGRRHQAG